MHLAENTIFEMLDLMEAHVPTLPARPAQSMSYFLLFYRRMIELVRGAVLLSRQTRDVSAPNVLLRSALECSIDLKNLACHEQYYLVLQAMELDNRYSVFRYKSAPAYSALVKEIGENKAAAMEKRLKTQSKAKLAEATKYFPILQNASHRLTVLNRFRIADAEELYQTRYTTLSMATHNDLTMLALQEELGLSIPIDNLGDSNVCSTALSFLVDTVKYASRLFGVNEPLVRGFIEQLERLKDIPERASA